jgi:hypothetical protein
VDVTAKHDVVENPHSPEEGEVLKCAGDAAPRYGVRRQAGNVLAEQGDAAGIRRIEAPHDIDHLGLAASVRADEVEDFAAMKVESYAFECLQAPERTLDAGAAEHRVVRVGGRLINH